MIFNKNRSLLILALLISADNGLVTAQSTTFTYQGKLADSGIPATGNYDFEFRLFDLASGGTQQGSTLSSANVGVTNGIFTVQLDFIACASCVPCPTCFNGSSRFLDIRVRPTGGGAFTTLTPRQPISSNPYAIKSLNATAADSLSASCVNCVTSSQVASVSGSVVTGTIPVASVPAGSSNYIQNSPNPQPQAFFDVSSGHFTGSVRIEGSGFIVPDTPSLSLSSTGSVKVDAPFLPGGRFTILENGNVGIGNGAPTQKLDVAGDARFTGDETVAGSLGVGSISAGSKLNVTGTGIVRARINSDSNGGLSLALSDQARWSIATVTGGDLVIYNDAVGQPAMSVNGSDNSVIVSSSISGNGAVRWQSVAGLTQQAQPNNGYLISNIAQATVNLPANPNVGDIVRVSGTGQGGWKITQNANQSVLLGNITLNGSNWTPHESNREWRSVASSADGTKLVAVVDSGRIYTSTDSGTTWTPRDSVRSWQSVASSADGSKLVAVVYGGQIYISTDSGATWTPRDSVRFWQSVASSADGSKLVAGVNSGQIYTSTDSGSSWTPRDSNRVWISVASSDDGTKLVAVALGGQIYTSIDSGVSWMPHESKRDWVSVASSADGTKLLAGVQDGQLYHSTDSGGFWLPTESNRHWYAVASSADGKKLVAADYTGQIYTSIDSGFGSFGLIWVPLESRRLWRTVASSSDATKLVACDRFGKIYTLPAANTTIGALGYLVGGQFTSIELQYVGNGVFLPLSHEGLVLGY